MASQIKALNEIAHFYQEHRVLGEGPSPKLNILLLGNHSSGKSSFINWFYKDRVMETSVAIETKKFCIVSVAKQHNQRRKRRMHGLNHDQQQDKKQHAEGGIRKFLGKASQQMFPNILEFLTDDQLDAVEMRVIQSLKSEVDPELNAVNIIDSPGLMDGSIGYKFQIDTIAFEIAKRVDLILVFLDPWVKATSSRTMNLIENIHGSQDIDNRKMKFLFSKADDVQDEQERQKCLMQIAQSVSGQVGGIDFDIMPIFIPYEDGDEPYLNITRRLKPDQEIPNHILDIPKMCKEELRFKVQQAMVSLQNDCQTTLQHTKNSIRQQTEFKSSYHQQRRKYRSCMLFSMLFPVSSLFYIIISFRLFLLVHRFDESMPQLYLHFLEPLMTTLDQIPLQFKLYASALMAFLSFFSYILARCYRPHPKHFHQSIAELQLQQEELEEVAIPTAKQTYMDYLSDQAYLG